MRVLIMAGGTGGHIFPALAVAKRLIEHGHFVAWLGSRYGMEGEIATANNIPIYFIAARGIRGKSFMQKLLSPWRLLSALMQSLWIMHKVKPDLVLGMGGYVTGPAGLAAWLLRRKLVIHEQNAIAGMTNRILARFSRIIMEGFPQSFPKHFLATHTGNPVREGFHRVLPPAARIGDQSLRLKVLIIGGSSGASALNKLAPLLLKFWPSTQKPLFWHQAGKKNMQDAQQAYAQQGININEVKLVDFIEDMPSAYSWADIIICRAGALTISEIAAIGVASILIPYPYAVDDHQTKNAQYLADAGAAIIIQERDLDADKLAHLLSALQANPGKLKEMAQIAYSLARRDALDLVIENVSQ